MENMAKLAEEDESLVISVKALKITHIANLETDASLNEIVELFANIIESVGYSPTSVAKALVEVGNNRL